MRRNTVDRSTRSLAQVARDEDVEIGYIAFDAIRERCPALGLAPGIAVHCIDRRDRDLVLRTAADREVIIDRFYAAFIEVRPVPSPHTTAHRAGDGARPTRSASAIPSFDSETRT